MSSSSGSSNSRQAVNNANGDNRSSPSRASSATTSSSGAREASVEAPSSSTPPQRVPPREPTEVQTLLQQLQGTIERVRATRALHINDDEGNKSERSGDSADMDESALDDGDDAVVDLGPPNTSAFEDMDSPFRPLDNAAAHAATQPQPTAELSDAALNRRFEVVKALSPPSPPTHEESLDTATVSEPIEGATARAALVAEEDVPTTTPAPLHSAPISEEREDHTVPTRLVECEAVRPTSPALVEKEEGPQAPIEVRSIEVGAPATQARGDSEAQPHIGAETVPSPVHDGGEEEEEVELQPVRIERDSPLLFCDADRVERLQRASEMPVVTAHAMNDESSDDGSSSGDSGGEKGDSTARATANASPLSPPPDPTREASNDAASNLLGSFLAAQLQQQERRRQSTLSSTGAQPGDVHDAPLAAPALPEEEEEETEESENASATSPPATVSTDSSSPGSAPRATTGTGPAARPLLAQSPSLAADSPTNAQTPTRRQQRRDESAEWVNTRRNTLEQLRVALEARTQATPTRPRGASRARSTSSLDVSTSAPPGVAPDAAGVAAALGDVESPARVVPQGMVAVDDSSPTPTKVSGITIRPNLSAISNVSPGKTEVTSMIPSTSTSVLSTMPPTSATAPVLGQKGHGTPRVSTTTGTTMPPQQQLNEAVWRSPRARSATATPTTVVPGRSPKPRVNSQKLTRGGGRPRLGWMTSSQISARERSAETSAVTANTTTTTSTAASAGFHIPGDDTDPALLEEKARRREQIARELEARELAECTFHPAISPGTRAMMDMQQASKLKEIEEHAAATAHTGPDATVPSSCLPVPPTLDNVYERLYPAKLSAVSAQRRLMEEEMECRRLGRQEMHELRVYSGAVCTGDTMESGYDTFLSNVLGCDCRKAEVEDLVAAGVVDASPYRSPMAVAVLEERAARRKFTNQRRKELAKRTGTEAAYQLGSQRGTSDSDSQEFRIALFDEFLLRQNAHYFNRARAVRHLEKTLTPDFTPKTTQASAELVEKMVQRSLVNESMGPETSAVIERSRALHVPVAGTVAPKHRSPYVDPCTFHPKVCPASQPDKTSQRTKNRYEALYDDHKRIAQQREEAKKQAEEDELRGFSFTPKVNTTKNTHVQSMLDPKNYARYEQYLKKKSEAEQAQRAERAVKEAHKEEDVCTFRPKTSKTPAFIARMANSFAVVRKQDEEF